MIGVSLVLLAAAVVTWFAVSAGSGSSAAEGSADIVQVESCDSANRGDLDEVVVQLADGSLTTFPGGPGIIRMGDILEYEQTVKEDGSVEARFIRNLTQETRETQWADAGMQELGSLARDDLSVGLEVWANLNDLSFTAIQDAVVSGHPEWRYEFRDASLADGTLVQIMPPDPGSIDDDYVMFLRVERLDEGSTPVLAATGLE